jgi:hypothetical protein
MSNMLPEEEEEGQGIGGVPECLIRDSKRIVPQGVLAKVDDTDAIGLEVSSLVSMKAHALTTLYYVEDGAHCKSVMHGQGQIGFIRREKIPPSPGETGRRHFAVVPVTARHNLRRTFDPKTQSWANARDASVWLRVKQPAVEKILCFEDLNWEATEDTHYTLRGDYSWEYGIDVSFAHKVSQRKDGISNEHSSFELVRPAFKLKKGQKVGIAVYFDEDAAPTNKTISPSDIPLDYTPTQIQDIYGKPFQPNIYTGEITYVEEGLQHIEYDFNTFTGCSGAIVFLLDRQQPRGSGVEKCDHGKAIAVHAGRHPGITNRNFGFILNEAMLPA